MTAQALNGVSTYLTFSLGEEIFAIDVANVREVLDLTDITRIPRTPEYMKGVINLRGGVVPVVDMRIKYGLPAGRTGTVKIEIYNVAGELVRTMTETAATGGTYYYTEWNGRNDDGKKAASGIYVARFTLNNGDEKFFKMAVVK